MSSPQGAVAPGRADPIARPGVSTTDLMLPGLSWGALVSSGFGAGAIIAGVVLTRP